MIKHLTTINIGSPFMVYMLCTIIPIGIVLGFQIRVLFYENIDKKKETLVQILVTTTWCIVWWLVWEWYT